METNTKNQNRHTGLSSREAALRLRKFGENSVYRKPRLRPLITFIQKLNSPLLLILIGASLISLFLGEGTNTIIILVMVLFSATLDFVNTYRSEKAVEKLISQVVTTTTVIRDGKKQELRMKYLVPGDVIFLSAGDIIPADCEILEAKDFFVNQASLTGESFPVEKSPCKKNNESRTDFEKENVIFMGTNAVTGYATATIIRTAKDTEFGKIAEKLAQSPPETDFEKGVKNFSLFIMKVTFVLVTFAFLTNSLLGRGILQSFIFAVAIAIGLTPELLPAIMAVAMSHGSILMAKKDVIVKHLPSIQSFGSMNILCTDKTGTLTEDRIILVKHTDGFGNNSEKVLLFSYLTSIFHTGIPSPLDAAIKDFKNLDIKAYEKIDEIPFDFERKRSSMIVGGKKGRTLICKGAPEDLLKVCDHFEKSKKTFKLDKDSKKTILSQYNKLSNEGFRVLGVAFKHDKHHRMEYSKKEERQMIFVGFVAFLDPPKQTVTSAVLELEKLGIELKILTGDSEILTKKICADIKLPIKNLLCGSQIETMTEQELGIVAAKTTVFARVTPEQKERIILALKKRGQVVGFLGDGINDAPALQAADVGISVNNAVEVAKETADIILLKKSLRVLKDGVVEGRKTFQNTLKYILMGLSSNFGNMFSLSLMPLFLNFLPMLPAQILFNNFLYDASQLTLATDDVDSDDVKTPPRWDMKFIKKYMMVFGPISSIFDFLTVFLLAFVFRVAIPVFQAGWFIESLATQVFVIYIIRTKKIPFLQSRPSTFLLLNTLLAVAVGWIIPFTPFGHLLGFQPLTFTILLTIAGIVIAYLFLAQLVKIIFYNRMKQPAASAILPETIQ